MKPNIENTNNQEMCRILNIQTGYTAIQVCLATINNLDRYQHIKGENKQCIITSLFENLIKDMPLSPLYEMVRTNLYPIISRDDCSLLENAFCRVMNNMPSIHS